MYQRSEAFFPGYQDMKLFYQVWEPVKSNGTLVITHGHGEHSDCYQRVVDAIEELSFTVYAWDLRGHGRSDGKRGYAAEFEDYVRDFEIFIQHLRRDRLSKDEFHLLAHSMGGLIQLKALTQNLQWPVQSQVLSSPMMGVAVEVPFIKDVGALLLKSLAPQVTLGNEVKYEALTRDPLIIQEYKADVMRHNKISSGVYLGAIVTMDVVRHQAGKIRMPTLLQIAEDDPVVGSEPNRSLFNKLGSKDKVLKEYPGREHEIYNDLGREEVFHDLVEFLKHTSQQKLSLYLKDQQHFSRGKL